MSRASIDRGSDQYPTFVKPSRIHEIKETMAGQKGWIVRNESEFHDLQKQLPDSENSLIVQEIVPGPESNISLHCAYLDAEGRPRQSFTGRKLRRYPPGFGSASMVISEIGEEAREISERFLTAIGFHGIAASEFKRDPRDGQLKLMEINPRPSLWFGITSEAGSTWRWRLTRNSAPAAGPSPTATSGRALAGGSASGTCTRPISTG